MSWVRIDDGLDEHKKLDPLFDGNDELDALAALGLWVLSLANSSRRLTDGHVSPRTLRKIAPEHGERLAEILTSAGFYDPGDSEHVIHDYLDYNPSRADVEDKRAKDAARKAAGRRSEVRKESTRTPSGSAAESARPDPDPVPTTPPTPPAGGRKTDLTKFAEDCQAFADAHFPDLGDDGGAAVTQAVRAGAKTLEAVTEVVDRWWRRRDGAAA